MTRCLVLKFAITMYHRQIMNKNTRTILRALANTRKVDRMVSLEGAAKAHAEAEKGGIGKVLLST